MKRKINPKTMLREHASVVRSLITTVFSLCASLSAMSQAMKIEEYTSNSSGNMNLTTEYSVSEWEASVIGFRAVNGDIYEDFRDDVLIQVYMDHSDITWKVKTGFRTTSSLETWSVNVLFVRKGFTSDSGIFPALNGNVGIGTTNPVEKLAVEGNIYSSGNIYSNGRVSIGTASPAAKLDVSGAGIFRNSAVNYLGLGHGGYNSFLDHHGAGNIDFRYEGANLMTLTQGGNLGIGTTDPTQKLHVNGDAYANTFVTSVASFPDYVFEESYALMPLPEMEAYVKANRHLPNMPSEREVMSEGMNLNEVMVNTVENVETIYLHLIRLEKKLTTLDQENRELKKVISENR